MNLHTPLTNVRGVGPKTGQTLSVAGLATVEDMLNFYPRTYEDYENVENVADVKPGKVVIRAKVEKINNRYARRNMIITTATLVDNNGDKVQATWFNQPYRKSQLENGGEFYFSGELSFKYGRYQIVSPTCQAVRGLPVTSDRIVPVYSVKAGLKPSLTKKIMTELKPLIIMLPETLPPDVVGEAGLMARSEAVKELHFPSSRERLAEARRRLAFEELFSLILAARMNRNSNQQLHGYQVSFNQPAIRDFVADLPFDLTLVQRRSAWEILQDFAGPAPMNRLLQGDVGSGKTVVAAIAAYQAAIDGYQTAIMVPTEVLATQHAATLNNLLAGKGISVALLTGSVKGKARDELLEHLANGDIQVLVGTHALFQPSVKFHKLGFVVIDEQHRFGVKQRQELLAKTDDRHLPHLLSMTATPIPRSLQLTVFGDLDVSTLDQLPKGRQVIKTKIILPNARAEVVDMVNQELSAGRQVYYITKLIEESATSEKTSAEALYKKVVATYPGYRVGILHGKMPAESKEKVMRQFEAHEIDILVSTTVVEVGVDVPNATVMVIENADQFGLAQLHQLRGRVGRGRHQSYCYLIQTDSKPPTRRLKEIERSNDGFHLAEVDLEMRGAGEIYGTAQHGELNLRIANLADTRMIHLASVEADKVMHRLTNNPEYLAKYPELNSIINRYQKLTTLN